MIERAVPVLYLDLDGTADWRAQATTMTTEGGDEMVEPESAEVEATEAEAVEDAPEIEAAADEASDDE